MKVYALIWEADYEGQQLIGVFSTREAAKEADPENEYYIHELDLDKAYLDKDYGFPTITVRGDTCLG